MKNIYTTILIALIVNAVGFAQGNNNSISNTQHNNKVHSSAHDSDHSNHHHATHNHTSETKQHKIQFTEGTLEINGIGDLTISATDGQEVIIESEVENHDHDKRSKGLKSLNSAGIDDNTGLGIAAIKEGSTLTLTQVGKDCNCNGVTVYVPKSVKISISHKTVDGDHVKVSDIANEIIISTLYQNIQLHNITGPMSVKTVYGEVEADFSKVSQQGSISINAVYGLVDVSLPSNTKANLELSANYGEIFSDMNVEVEKNEGMQSLSTTKIKGLLNDGGVLINLKSSYDNIYLRSK